MEKITLNNRQLDFLASHDPVLEPFFFGTVPCDKLPRHPDKSNPTGYIVNTDPHYLPGKHWIALWTDGKTCEVMDSYALPLNTYGTTDPLVDWLNKHWKYVIHNGQSLQSLYSQSCGDYALMYLRARARGLSMETFVGQFSKHDYVHNDHKVGQMLKKLIEKQIASEEWYHVCKMNHHQNTHACKQGVRHLV